MTDNHLNALVIVLGKIADTIGICNEILKPWTKVSSRLAAIATTFTSDDGLRNLLDGFTQGSETHKKSLEAIIKYLKAERPDRALSFCEQLHETL